MIYLKMEQNSKKSDEAPLQATKLLVDNINPRVRHKSLRDCLRVFGTIRSLVLKKRKSKQRSYAFVTFGTAAEALRAYNCLLIKTLWHPVLVIPFLGGKAPKKVTTRSHPPEADYDEDKLEIAYYRFEKNPDDLINNLNNDCLARIFSFLPISQRFTIGQVCRRWQVVSQQSWRSFNKFSLSPTNWYSSSATKNEDDEHIFSFAGMSIVRETSIVRLLKICGAYVTELDLSTGSNVHSTAILINIFKLCPNVRVLNLRHYKYNNPSSIKSLADNCPKIEHLILDESLFYDCYQEHMCRIFSKNEIRILELHGDMSDKIRRRIRCRYLRELVVSHTQSPMLMHRIIELAVNLRRFKYEFNSKDTIFYRKSETEFLQCLFRSQCSETLEDLEIVYRFSNYELQARLEAPPSFTNLRKLSLRGGFYVDDKFLIAVCRTNPRLEHVDVSNCAAVTNASLTIVARLPRLARLAIEGSKRVTDEIFDGGECRKLEVLRCKGCVEMRPTGLMKLIRSSLASLRLLDLEGCTEIGDDFVNDLVDRVKERNEGTVLTLNVLNTQVTLGAENLPAGLKFSEIS